MTEDYTTDSAAIKPHEELFAVFLCWYEGDSNLVQDSLVGIATSLESAIKTARSSAESEPDAIYMPGECVPDDGGYGDERKRYRIDVIRINEVYHHYPRANNMDMTSMFKNCTTLTTVPHIPETFLKSIDVSSVFKDVPISTEKRRSNWERLKKLLRLP